MRVKQVLPFVAAAVLIVPLLAAMRVRAQVITFPSKPSLAVAQFNSSTSSSSNSPSTTKPKKTKKSTKPKTSKPKTSKPKTKKKTRTKSSSSAAQPSSTDPSADTSAAEFNPSVPPAADRTDPAIDGTNPTDLSASLSQVEQPQSAQTGAVTPNPADNNSGQLSLTKRFAIAGIAGSGALSLLALLKKLFLP